MKKHEVRCGTLCAHISIVMTSSGHVILHFVDIIRLFYGFMLGKYVYKMQKLMLQLLVLFLFTTWVNTHINDYFPFLSTKKQ